MQLHAGMLATAIASLAVPMAVGHAQRAQATDAFGARPAVSVSITFPASLSAKALDGRLLLMISTDSTQEPRFQIEDFVSTQQVFGIDVDGMKPGMPVAIGSGAAGYPLRSLADLPAGTYWVQGLLHIYETFRRSDGHVVKLPMDRGEGQQWNLAPGNLYSTPRKIRLDPKVRSRIAVMLDRTIAPIPPVPDTKYVKHLKLRSELLSKFWGRDIYLGAIVMLPEGWDTHPSARYPLAVAHGHFQATDDALREAPPDASLPMFDADSIARYCPNGHEGAWCTRFGYPRMMQEYAHNFYKEWTGPGFPRVIKLTIQHANQYYDDSYAVNSENLGPYGDAITYELIPYIEQRFRGLGAWARATYGGSTGGWEALGAQVKYPDEYNGAYVNCPDPIDFRQYTVVNLYEDKNAYYTEGPFRRTLRPGQRDYLGATRATLEDLNRRELALGSKSRSGQQWDIWEAVFSPVGADGYPKRIWNKETGEIDKAVTEFWKQHYDLSYIMRRDWRTLGPKLRGKLEINVGLSDNYFLNNSVYQVEDFLTSVTNPPADAVVHYGQRDEHCWSGDASLPNAMTRLTYDSRFIRKMAAHWIKTAGPGADTVSWRY